MKTIRIALLSFLIAAVTFAPVDLAQSNALVARANNASGVLSVGTGTFIAYATTSSSGAKPNAPLTLLNSNGAQYFYIRNTGTIAITAVTVNLSYTSSTGATTFQHCNAQVVFSALNTCASGTSTSLSTSGTFAFSLSIQPNSWYEFELDPNKKTTPTISVTVSSSQIRPGFTTNS